MSEIENKTYRLSSALRKLLNQKYDNGSPVAKIYEHSGDASSETQGPIVTFNLLRSDGTYVGYAEASLSNFTANRSIWLYFLIYSFFVRS